MLTNKNLADFCLKKVNVKTKYMWGDYGRIITAENIANKAKQYPARYTAARQAELKKCIGTHYGCDCNGLIKWFLWTDNDAHAIKYNAKTDRNCSGLYNAAKEKGKIDTLPETVGILLYMSGHVGVYVGDGYAVECTLGSYGDGVVKTKVKGRGWTYWLKLPEIEYVEEKKEEEKEYVPAVGDKVYYTGNIEYNNANSLIPHFCKKGLATVTNIYHPEKSRHPYHLIKIGGKGSTVYGWVNKGTFYKVDN